MTTSDPDHPQFSKDPFLMLHRHGYTPGTFYIRASYIVMFQARDEETLITTAQGKEILIDEEFSLIREKLSR